MRILFLSQIIPYPPDAGPKVKTWHVLRYLIGCGHQVTLAAFVRPKEKEYLPIFRQYNIEVHGVPIHRSRVVDMAFWFRSQVTGNPFLVERDNLPEMRSLVNRLVQSGQVDVIHADQLTMAQFGIQDWGQPLNHGSQAPNGPLRKPILVFDAHNAVWTIVDRMRQNASPVFKPLIGLEANRVKKYEGGILKKYDYSLAVTDLDRQALLQAVKSTQASVSPALDRKIRVIPIAIDSSQLNPVNRQPGSTNLVTLGTLHYPPNADGIRWFAKKAFPIIRQQIPDATLTIIGKNPPADFLHLEAQSQGSIKVVGYVPDLTPYLEQAALMVIPVRAGGGMRVRILEAFSRAIPVLTTQVGLEGIDAVPGRDVLVEDTPEDLADAAVRLLRDPALQTQLANNGRKLATNLYDWQIVLKKLGEVYEEIEHLYSLALPSH